MARDSPSSGYIVLAEVENTPVVEIMSKLPCKPADYSFILLFRMPQKFHGHWWTFEWCSTWSVQGVRGMGYTRIRFMHSGIPWAHLSYGYYLLMLGEIVWAQQIQMNKTAMEDRSVEVHPCGTPTLDIPQEQETPYYAEFTYCIYSMSSIGL
jgi:hypothetical protein